MYTSAATVYTQYSIVPVSRTQIFMYTVEPRVADTLEMMTSTVMWTLRAVLNVSCVPVYKTTPETRTPL